VQPIRIFSLFAAFALIATGPAAAAVPPSDASPAIVGFTAAHAADERALEARFDAALNAGDLRAWMERLTRHPHHVGSPWDKSNMDFILGLYKSWGYDAHEERFDVLFPTPKQRLLELTAPTTFKASLTEDAVAGDRSSQQQSEYLPTFNAYSPDGDVRGSLVYVNYGLQADYDVLAQHGIDVRGKIVIARYGHAWRGIKPKVAAEHGAIGCIIYSDPANDGFGRGDTYPKGPWRAPSSVQRGAVTDDVYLGDPSMPGRASLPGSTGRLTYKQAQTIAAIPTMPISYRDAQPLLAALGGAAVPGAWHGGLAIPYRFGGGAARVHMIVKSNWKITPIYDVIARMTGSVEPNVWTIRGNHEDAWVSGAADPISGQVAVLEEARAVSVLAKSGWRPKRTMIYCAWDAEEPGLLGSTAWTEAHHEELAKNAALYVNSDTNGRGFFFADGTHSIESMLNGIAKDVQDPERPASIYARARAAEIVGGDRSGDNEDDDIHLGAPGSGSDYASFSDYYGIPVMDIGFAGENGDGGVYHSAYDSFAWYVKYGDPAFAYGVTLAKVGGRAMLRFADADVLPYRYAAFAKTLDRYRSELIKLVDDTRAATATTNRHLAQHVGELAADPHEPYVAPQPLGDVPTFEFSTLTAATERLTAASAAYDTAADAALARGVIPPAADPALVAVERGELDDRGLPRRPLYKNQIYEPGYYTGYDAKTMPGIREALEARNWDEARSYIPTVTAVVNSLADRINAAAATLR
jgi:N-acetylated-alpha-linked acidic dipeptidase